MAEVKAVIFDFGGVLVRMVDDRPRQQLALELGIPLNRLDYLVYYSDSAQRASLGQIAVAQHWEAVGSALGIKPEAMPGFLKRFWSAEEVNWELLEFIRSLRPRFRLGLLSNAWDDLRQTIHERWNLDALFDDLIISAEVNLVKPDPGIFNLAVEQLGVRADEAIFIDDLQENIAAAKAQGLIAFQFIDTPTTISQINGWINNSEV